MALNYTSDIMALYTAKVGNDANYQSPGNFGLPAADAGPLVGVASTTIGTRGSYTTIPAATTTGGATFQTRMRLLTVATVASAGTSGAVPGAVVTILGGVQPTPATLTITDTTVLTVTIVGVGSGGTPGAATLTGTTGAGTKFQATVVIQVGGTLTGAPTPVVTVGGDYTTNPTSLAVEPVTATASLVGVTVAVTMGVLTATILAAGVISTLPTSPVSVSGATGATFTFTYAVDSLVVTAPGTYEDGSAAPTITFASGAATATATLAVAGTSGVNTEKLLTMVEVIRSLIAETTTPNQLRDIHEILRKMMMTMKWGGPITYTAANFATNARAAAMNYIAKNPTHGHQPLIQGF